MLLKYINISQQKVIELMFLEESKKETAVNATIIFYKSHTTAKKHNFHFIEACKRHSQNANPARQLMFFIVLQTELHVQFCTFRIINEPEKGHALTNLWSCIPTCMYEDTICAYIYQCLPPYRRYYYSE